MGFQRKTLTLTSFPNHPDLEGLEVTLRRLPLGPYLELTGLGGESERNSVSEMIREFSKALISWNLEDETGEPVPATPEAVFAEDHEMMLAIANAWMDHMGGVAAPLEQSSDAGEPSPEVSIPMEPLSESLAS